MNGEILVLMGIECKQDAPVPVDEQCEILFTLVMDEWAMLFEKPFVEVVRYEPGILICEHHSLALFVV